MNELTAAVNTHGAQAVTPPLLSFSLTRQCGCSFFKKTEHCVTQTETNHWFILLFFFLSLVEMDGVLCFAECFSICCFYWITLFVLHDQWHKRLERSWAFSWSNSYLRCTAGTTQVCVSGSSLKNIFFRCQRGQKLAQLIKDVQQSEKVLIKHVEKEELKCVRIQCADILFGEKTHDGCY